MDRSTKQKVSKETQTLNDTMGQLNLIDIYRCEWGIKVSHYYCVTVNFPFILVSICLTYCGAPMLGVYIFIIVISSSWIEL